MSWAGYEQAPKKSGTNEVVSHGRWRIVKLCICFALVSISFRLWHLQVRGHDAYAQQAVDQQTAYQLLTPERGIIYASDSAGKGDVVPIAVNRDAFFVYAEPKKIEDVAAAVGALAPLIGKDPEVLRKQLDQPQDPFEPLLHRAPSEVAAAVRALEMPGIGLITERERFYPGNNIASHVLGFVSYRNDRLVGQYGIEGSMNGTLVGVSGSADAERTTGGVLIALGDNDTVAAQNGSDVVLTIDWTLEYKACRLLEDWVRAHGASSGSLIVMNPKTGAILAMCGAPDFNPNIYGETERIVDFNNPSIFLDYEPGSIMKPLTMAAALDQQKVSPTTTYTDTGEVKIGSKTIRNSDNKANGLQTMTDVLTKSLNTGAIYSMRQVGVEVFRKYLVDFGFSVPTGIELPGEATGDIRSLRSDNEIYGATASFGQGITTTPLQMVTAYAAIANGGELMRPYIIKEIRQKNGTVIETKPTAIRRVIRERTAALLSGMLVTVIDSGHGKRAGVAGYTLAGKTGTAEIASRNGGYEAGATIGSFVGFGPVRDPQFAMIVRVDRPKDVQYAESSAAPLFGQVAKFLLQYYEIPPDR
ncbi:MAG: penicillin-binding protein 2 [Patescibacteria group bacterium]